MKCGNKECVLPFFISVCARKAHMGRKVAESRVSPQAAASNGRRLRQVRRERAAPAEKAEPKALCFYTDGRKTADNVSKM